MAAGLAVKLGYTAVYLLSEGIPGWENKGFVVTAGPRYESTIDMPKLPVKELKQMMEGAPGSFVLLDVREKNEFAGGHIPGAVNIPLSNFSAAANLERGKKLVIYCATGARLYNAYRKLRKMSFTDISQTSFIEWKAANMPVE